MISCRYCLPFTLLVLVAFLSSSAYSDDEDAVGSQCGDLLVRLDESPSIGEDRKYTYQVSLRKKTSNLMSQEAARRCDAYVAKEVSRIMAEYKKKLISNEDRKVFSRLIKASWPDMSIADAQPLAWSPDRNRIALSVTTRMRFNAQSGLIVIDKVSRKVLFKEIYGKGYVGRMAWNESGTSLGVLVIKGKTGLMPWELLALLAGHPIPYNSFSLEIVNIDRGVSEWIQVAKKLRYGSGYIYWVDNGDK